MDFLLDGRGYRNHLAMKELIETNTILDAFMKNEELLFQCTLVTANADDTVGKEILRRCAQVCFCQLMH